MLCTTRQPTRQPALTQNNQTALALAVPLLSDPAVGLRLTAVTPQSDPAFGP